jgi:hypothetical protein
MSRTGHQGLYPIIRRVRRPLLPVDPPAESKPAAIIQADQSKPAEAPEVADDEKADASDASN